MINQYIVQVLVEALYAALSGCERHSFTVYERVTQQLADNNLKFDDDGQLLYADTDTEVLND